MCIWFLESSIKGDHWLALKFEDEADLLKNIRVHDRPGWDWRTYRSDNELSFETFMREKDTEALYFLARSRTGSDWSWVTKYDFPSLLRSVDTLRRVNWQFKIWKAAAVAYGL